jgi:hypothetical protein
MTYSRELTFPVEPTPSDLKDLRRQVFRAGVKVIDGAKKGSSLRVKRPRRKS